MENHRLPRHSASHGTLRSTYSSHGRPGHGTTSLRPLHKPLRSVNENSVLLPSPGALESMLKTTTETGDIGIFSIKPVLLSPRPSVEGLHRRTHSDKSAPSRDTASEIVSMYGSESHRSATSTLTPTSPEDVGPRSYSMTTCGSRHLSHHRSTATLQSQTSGGPLQRPRSPFPYPTRLKRPGVRPASPALTESGQVDYSRMVEIDRVSYRTGHRPYKPSYPPLPRRPPPLSLRTAANLSTTSLPPLGPLGSRNELSGPPSPLTLSTTSIAPWGVPYRDRLDSSRTSSLTSIVNMYHRMPYGQGAGLSSLSAAAPRYYDYTEGFENGQHRVATPFYPLAPVPTHPSRCLRPLVLQHSDDNLGTTFGEGDSVLFEHDCQNPSETNITQAPQRQGTPAAEGSRTALYRAPLRSGSIRSETRSGVFDAQDNRKPTRGSDIDMLPSQAGRESLDTFNPSLDLESKDASAYGYTDYRTTTITTSKTKKSSPERQVQVQGGKAPSVRSEQGLIYRDDTQDEVPYADMEQEDGADITDKQSIENRQYGGTERRSYSEPVQSVVNGSCQHDALPGNQYNSGAIAVNDSHNIIAGAIPYGTIRTSLDDAKHDSGDCDNSPGSNIDENDNGPAPMEHARVATPRQRSNHKRSKAVPRISTSSMPNEGNEGFPRISPSCSTTPIVSPKPISPARQLKLKNSIPQLMKALPFLPGDPDYEPLPAPSLQSTPSNEGDFAEVLSPFKFSQSSPSCSLRGKKAESPASILGCGQASGTLKNVPKLRLRMKTSNESGVTVSSDTRHLATYSDGPCSPSTPHSNLEARAPNSGDMVRLRSRLRLRSSRSATLSTPPSETIRRSMVVSTSSIVADISRRRPRDLFSLSASSSPAISKADESPLQSPQDRRLSAGSNPSVIGSPNSAHPSILEDQQSNLTRGTKPMETLKSPDVKHQQDFKAYAPSHDVQLTRSSSSSTGPVTSDGKEHNTDADICLTNDDGDVGGFAISHGHRARGNRKRVTLRRRMGAKLLKWVKGAKAAVRVYAKRNRKA
ncbi:hypothetical protein GGR52DRAFT_334193 [Hypoxylon sp. FL1284]|nr:hypothetical protein GGR52DRAFT_334193 [Hypoxylon sp. FL1284]